MGRAANLYQLLGRTGRACAELTTLPSFLPSPTLAPSPPIMSEAVPFEAVPLAYDVDKITIVCPSLAFLPASERAQARTNLSSPALALPPLF